MIELRGRIVLWRFDASSNGGGRITVMVLVHQMAV